MPHNIVSVDLPDREMRIQMSDFILSCCTTIDTNKNWAETYSIACVPFHFEIGGTAYTDDFWTSMQPEEMYERMKNGEDSKTSQVSVGEYTEHFRRFLDEGKDILHLTLSSGISGTINSAQIAADDLREQYPDRKLIIMDSLAASSGYGLFLYELARQRALGHSIDEVYAYAKRIRLTIHHWFFSSDLTFFIKGGRVTKAAGFVGSLLNICPLLNVDFMGRLIPREKIRTKKKVIARIVEKMETFVIGGTDYDGPCYISQSACPEDAEAVRDLVETKFKKLKGKVKIFPVGPTIGCHTGPGCVALFFLGEEREKE